MYSVLRTITATDDPNIDLATLDVVKAALGITGSDEDALLQAQISNASRTLLAICDLVTPSADYIETFYFERIDQFPIRSRFNSHHPRPLVLSRVPVNFIDRITVDGAELNVDDSDTDDDVILDSEAGMLRRVDGSAWGGKVVVSYNAGYEFPDRVPGPLLSELFDLVQDARVTAAMSADATGSPVAMVRHGDSEVSYSKPVYGDGAKAISADMMTRLSRYRRLAAI